MPSAGRFGASNAAASDLVLVGGGHAHVHVLAAFAAKAVPGLRLTLVTRDLHTPYSGLLPGVVAGHYAARDAHIDLRVLARRAGARLVHGSAAGLDRQSRRIMVDAGDPVAYDIVSLDIGIAPSLGDIDGAAAHAIPVKPIGAFLARFDRLLAQARRPGGPRRIVVVGGGAGGVELLLSVHARLFAETGGPLDFALVTRGEILATHNGRVRDAFRRILAERGIALHERSAAAAVRPGAVVTRDGRIIPADAVLVTTGAAGQPWLAGAGLVLHDGFVAVGPTLQSLGDPDVFAAGDCAALVETPREKAGVYAVRAGPPLARNLALHARGQAPLAWRPQSRHLALITTGERYAVASRGAFKAEGAWAWWLKDRIDRRWMARYRARD